AHPDCHKPLAPTFRMTGAWAFRMRASGVVAKAGSRGSFRSRVWLPLCGADARLAGSVVADLGQPNIARHQKIRERHPQPAGEMVAAVRAVRRAVSRGPTKHVGGPDATPDATYERMTTS